LRAALVDCAKPGEGIQGDAGSVAPLLHAAHTVMLDDKLLRYIVDSLPELDDQVAATAAAGAGGKVICN